MLNKPQLLADTLIKLVGLSVIALVGVLPVLGDSGLPRSDWNTIREEYERNRHNAFAVPGGYRARNYGQHWVTDFDGRGFEIQPDGAQWKWGLQLESYGWSGQERLAHIQPKVTSEHQRIAYVWDQNLREWWVNDARGLEHGFTLQERPSGDGDRLTFRIAVRGGLNAHAQRDGHGLKFVDAAGQVLITEG